MIKQEVLSRKSKTYSRSFESFEDFVNRVTRVANEGVERFKPIGELKWTLDSINYINKDTAVIIFEYR